MQESKAFPDLDLQDQQQTEARPLFSASRVLANGDLEGRCPCDTMCRAIPITANGQRLSSSGRFTWGLKTVASKTFDKIRDAAAELFARNGFRGASTRAISEAAGRKEPEIFRLFASKEQLFHHCLTVALSESLEPAQLLMIVYGQEQAPFPELLGKAIRAWYSSLSPQSARLLMQAALSNNKQWSKLAFSRIDKTIGVLANTIEKELRLPKVKAFAAANSLILALFQYKISRPMLTTLQSERETTEQMIQNWLEGISRPS